MSNGMIALIAIGLSIAYLIVTGVACALFEKEDDYVARGIGSILWPITLSWAAGMALVSWIRMPRKAKLPNARVVK